MCLLCVCVCVLCCGVYVCVICVCVRVCDMRVCGHMRSCMYAEQVYHNGLTFFSIATSLLTVVVLAFDLSPFLAFANSFWRCLIRLCFCS